MQRHELLDRLPGVVEDSVDEMPLTRRQAAEFLSSRGFRISHSTLAKLCSPAIDEGPASCGMFGRDRMYYPSVLLAWAKKRMSRSCTGG